MDFFNDLSRKFSKAARSVQMFTREGTENGRLDAELRDAQRELEQAYAELGRVFYESIGSPDADIPPEAADRVRAALDRVDALTQRRDRRVRCPGCGAVQAPDARYCSHCGRRMPEDAPEPVAPEDDRDYCPGCGAMKRDGEAFCAVCGRALTQEPAVLSPSPEIKPAPPAASPLEEPEQFEE